MAIVILAEVPISIRREYPEFSGSGLRLKSPRRHRDIGGRATFHSSVSGLRASSNAGAVVSNTDPWLNTCAWKARCTKVFGIISSPSCEILSR